MRTAVRPSLPDRLLGHLRVLNRVRFDLEGCKPREMDGKTAQTVENIQVELRAALVAADHLAVKFAKRMVVA